jgi:hypothetical protein
VRVLEGLACAEPRRSGKKVPLLLPVGLAAMNWLLRSLIAHNEGPPLKKAMFIGAVTMIGLALTGSFQMRVAHSPVVAAVAQ